jgi:hypothetical protein
MQEYNATIQELNPEILQHQIPEISHSATGRYAKKNPEKPHSK